MKEDPYGYEGLLCHCPFHEGAANELSIGSVILAWLIVKERLDQQQKVALLLTCTAIALMPADLRPSLPDVAVPTLILSPEDDRLVGPEVAGEMDEGIPDAQEVVLEGTGHL